MRFLPSTSFQPEQESAVLLPELARVCRQLGVQFVRASVVEVRTLAYRAAWSISETGDIAPAQAGRAMDSAFAGAAAAIASLADAEPEETLVHRQSPRRWAFTWSLDNRLAVVAEVQYRERRDAVGDLDRVLVRLLCAASVRSHTLNEPDTLPNPPELVWPQVDRRARRPPPLGLWLALALMLAAGLLLGWIALMPAATPSLLQVALGAGAIAALAAAVLLGWHLAPGRRKPRR
jgi:hypothetical protein